MAAVYALVAALCWTAASQLYASVSRSMNVRQVNIVKAVISLSLFAVLSYFFFPHRVLERETIFWLSVSGVVGFALGDLFLFYAFAKIGPARTLMIAGFAPAIIAAISYFFFDDPFPLKKLWGLGLMLACVYMLSREKESRALVTRSILLIAFLGIFLDSFGVALSKHAFRVDPELNPSHANFHRILAALPVLALVYYRHEDSRKRKISRRELLTTLVAAFLGTFLALFFYLKALSLENAAIVSAISLSSPFFSSLYEHARDRQWPKPQFAIALLLMLTAVWILI
jgi:drug/metabolite transporter (DMT)-like permease